MVKPLNRVVRPPIMLAYALSFIMMHAPLAIAQGLTDPTRPPAALRNAQDGEAQSAFSGPVLQSVLVSPGRKVAIISGKTVKLGEKYGDARVTKITESEVTLKGAHGVQILKLYPGVEKDTTSHRKPVQADGRRQ